MKNYISGSFLALILAAAPNSVASQVMIDDVALGPNFNQSYVEISAGYNSSAERETGQPNQVQALKKALVTYKTFAYSGGWKGVRHGGKIEVGMTDPRVSTIRTRLQAEGYGDIPLMLQLVNFTYEDPNYFDDALSQSVIEFQSRHGLEADGVVGAKTIDALNESVESKIDRIETALQDWSEYGDLGENYIWANIPSFTAEAWEKGERKIRMRTIVGKKLTSTPAFSDEIETIVANPNWYLPTSLFKRQKLAKLIADPSYAPRHNYRIYDRASGQEVSAQSVNWTSPDVARDYQMVQDAGANNALGNVKILFPNSNAVYMHGTPDQHLFKKTSRALSSGCVRLEDPVKMANWISDQDENVSTAAFNDMVKSKTRKHFALAKHVPVHITYIGVTADEDGGATFLPDIYSRHKKPIQVTELYEENITNVASFVEIAGNPEGS